MACESMGSPVECTVLGLPRLGEKLTQAEPSLSQAAAAHLPSLSPSRYCSTGLGVESWSSSWKQEG